MICSVVKREYLKKVYSRVTMRIELKRPFIPVGVWSPMPVDPGLSTLHAVTVP